MTGPINSLEAKFLVARQKENEIAKEKFITTFGSLSSPILDFLKSEFYNELLEALNTFYIKDDKARLEASTIFTIDLKNPEELARLHDLKTEFQGRLAMMKNLEDLKEAIKEVRVI